MTTVRLPTPLRAYAEGKKEVKVEAGTVADALQALTQLHPNLSQHLFDSQGDLRLYVNLYVNDENMRDLQGVETQVENGDRLMIVPSIAGGL
jgi:molybdopterin converting factor small subunit